MAGLGERVNIMYTMYEYAIIFLQNGAMLIASGGTKYCIRPTNNFITIYSSFFFIIAFLDEQEEMVGTCKDTMLRSCNSNGEYVHNETLIKATAAKLKEEENNRNAKDVSLHYYFTLLKHQISMYCKISAVQYIYTIL
jgi:hypothetical protein